MLPAGLRVVLPSIHAVDLAINVGPPTMNVVRPRINAIPRQSKKNRVQWGEGSVAYVQNCPHTLHGHYFWCAVHTPFQPKLGHLVSAGVLAPPSPAYLRLSHDYFPPITPTLGFQANPCGPLVDICSLVEICMILHDLHCITGGTDLHTPCPVPLVATSAVTKASALPWGNGDAWQCIFLAHGLKTFVRHDTHLQVISAL